MTASKATESHANLLTVALAAVFLLKPKVELQSLKLEKNFLDCNNTVTFVDGPVTVQKMFYSFWLRWRPIRHWRIHVLLVHGGFYSFLFQFGGFINPISLRSPCKLSSSLPRCRGPRRPWSSWGPRRLCPRTWCCAGPGTTDYAFHSIQFAKWMLKLGKKWISSIHSLAREILLWFAWEVTVFHLMLLKLWMPMQG